MKHPENWNMRLPDDMNTPELIEAYAKKYLVNRKVNVEEENSVINIMTHDKRPGYMTRADLIAVAKWKSKRNIHAEKNTCECVEEITGASFAAKCERLRIGALLSLQGVDWPTASAILHLRFLTETSDKAYPIFDIWAMKTIQSGIKTCNFEKWMKYVCWYRDAIKDCKIEMRTPDERRTLDRALWAYGEEKEK